MEINNIHWLMLSPEQKDYVIKYCNTELTKEKPDMFSETGEPIYLDEESKIIDISSVIDGVYNTSQPKQK